MPLVFSTAFGRQALIPYSCTFEVAAVSPISLPGDTTQEDRGSFDHLSSTSNSVQTTPSSAIIGFSLGGNVLLKWLGEMQEKPTLKKAVAVSVPFRLDQCAERLNQGVSRLYRNYLLRKMRSSYKRKFALIQSPLDVDVNCLKAFAISMTRSLHPARFQGRRPLLQ